jgi:ribonuclease D
LTTLEFITTQDGLDALTERLIGCTRIAVDLEAAGFHRYSDRVCLLQLSTESESVILDTLAIDPSAALRPALEDSDCEVVVHGADYDMRLLDRDLGIAPNALFDTQIAATLLGEPSIGLAALLAKYMDVHVSKKHQRADWAMRPLTQDMLDYAASDTRHLFELADLLSGKVETLGRTAWVREECDAMEALKWAATDVDPVTRFKKKARDLDAREIHRLREVWMWRDKIAKRRDRAPFRIAGDPVLLEAATTEPRSIQDLLDMKGMPRRLAEQSGAELLSLLGRVDALDEGELKGYPPRPTGGPGRPLPEEEERMERLKKVRNEVSDELGLQRGVILSNASLMAIARRKPASLQELEEIDVVRKWHIEVIGQGFLDAMDP